METHLSEDIKNSADGKLVESILRSCVHCGFCNATCPSYQVIGDENDGPRGRIYLMKQMMEGKLSTDKTLAHLDRCLTCRNCETTCPSGVQYGKLLDVGRKIAESKTKRDSKDQKMREMLRKTLPYTDKFSAILTAGRIVKPLLPKALKAKIPAKRKALDWPVSQHERTMLILDGCVQPAISPDINAATAVFLDKLGITVKRVRKAGCCGAVSQHLAAEDEALDFMRRNIDAWWGDINNGVEAIISTASGCGVMLKDYHHYLRHDPDYASKAALISKLSKDICEIVINEAIPKAKTPKRLAFHPPCTLQHGQKINGVVEMILNKAGHKLVPIRDKHLCCGSAGTYSILQKDISVELRSRKMENLMRKEPEMIVTANIGCQSHLQEASDIPVVHWITLFA